MTEVRNKLDLLLKEYVGQEFDHDTINRLEAILEKVLRSASKVLGGQRERRDGRH